MPSLTFETPPPGAEGALIVDILGFVVQAGGYRYADKIPSIVASFNQPTGFGGYVDVYWLLHRPIIRVLALEIPVLASFKPHDFQYVKEVSYRLETWEEGVVTLLAHELQHVEDIFDGVAFNRISDALRYLMEVRAETKAHDMLKIWREAIDSGKPLRQRSA